MLFSQQRGCKPLCTLGVLVVVGMGLLLGCEADITEQDEVFTDAAQRVEDNVLPILVAESETAETGEGNAVLRNLTNLLAALPEICATRLAALRTFASSLPTLGTPDTITFDTDGSWELTWQDRVLGDDDTQLTVDTTTPRVDITLTIRFRSQGLQTLLAIPFSLVPQTALQTAGEPPSFAAGTTEGFFLFQDAASGLWTLRWRSLGTTKVFEGHINATALTRVVRRVAAGTNNAVTSLAVNEATNEISFQETTEVADQKGFTFFARPGDTVRFRLRIGANANALQGITREQLRIGGENQPLPDNLSPADFSLTSNLPINPTNDTNAPPITQPGTFVWQEVNNKTCNPEEDQWRMRFSRQASATTFSGIVRSLDESVRLRTTAVGACPAGRLEDEDRTFVYDCTLSADTESGYDICVTAGKSLDFTPEVGQVQDPGFVFVGAMAVAPPSPDPFTILFDLDLAERQSSRNLRFSEGNVVLRGNNETEDAPQPKLNPDQVSLEPLCGKLSAEVESVVGVVSQVQPKVRLTGGGDYATTRFEGSAYVLENVEFTDDNVDSLNDFRRFPDRGDILLQTRIEDEDATITAPTEEIVNRNGQARAIVDVELRVDDVLFSFPNQEVGLTVE